jgi:hypothetical protein
LDTPAFVTLANGENYSRKLQAIKNYNRNSKNKTGHQFEKYRHSHTAASAPWILHDLWSRV